MTTYYEELPAVIEIIEPNPDNGNHRAYVRVGREPETSTVYLTHQQCEVLHVGDEITISRLVGTRAAMVQQ